MEILRRQFTGDKQNAGPTHLKIAGDVFHKIHMALSWEILTHSIEMFVVWSCSMSRLAFAFTRHIVNAFSDTLRGAHDRRFAVNQSNRSTKTYEDGVRDHGHSVGQSLSIHQLTSRISQTNWLEVVGGRWSQHFRFEGQLPNED